MSPSSFKKDVGTPPSRYRTPSPPRFAFEPLSPANPNIKLATTVVQNTTDGYPSEIKKLTQCQAHTDRAWHKQERDARNTMDTFASIALATHQLPYTSYAAPSSGIPHSELPLTVETQYTERPPKRARSEKVQSLEWTRSEAKTGTRPVTSYAQTTDTRTLDAELLLNFSHAARFAYPYGFSGQTSFNQPKQVSPTAFPIPVDLISPALCNFVPKQALQTSLATGTHVSPSLAAKEGALSCGEDTQDFSTSNECNDLSGSKSELVAQGKNYETNGSKFPLSGYKKPETLHLDTFEVGHEGISHKIDDENTLGYDVATLPTSLSNEILMNGRLDRPAMETNVNTGLVATSRHQQQSTHKLDGIVAGDLASTSPIDVTDEAASTNEPDLHASYDHKPNESYTLTSTDDNIQSTLRQTSTPAICTTCQFTRNSLNIDNDNGPTSWISCDACKSWFHFACAGFKNEREVRSVDKYRCRECKPLYGPTTYVRKSSRAHSAIDYAGLNQGVLKTSDERTEHHYIKPIKDGKIVFLPETFARMRPELVTAEYFEKGNGMREPIIIPAHFNPRHKNTAMQHPGQTQQDGTSKTGLMQEISLLEEWLSDGVECQSVPDYGQDALDMVMPRDLTVRMVADLYGPEEKVEVIDVKSQNGENKKWNMKRWADYYESSGNKTVRNVISLEVSQSKLGRLIRRPQIVRELDLQDSVWPLELQAKGEYPRVQLYCLMSVADCFTDFHIDFGGSSVFYHILKGKKTFLFIPPKEKHLKKYEEWCLSPAQNWTFLADQTKECYRVDLVEGDTMLIPAGWIHAVWTPEDSLVIGGNFLTRMHYGMQLRVAQAEKVTGVARKFRYPHYQKIHWYTALQYLQDDPLPQTVKDMLQEGGVFHRDKPAHHAFDEWGENSEPGLENYHARYYAQTELEGLPDLVRYLLRTALIDLGNITDGITAETRNAVKRAIPRGYGEPLDIIKEFAAWCAWKRGNEQLPHWAYPHAVPEGGVSDKLNATTLKKLDQEAAIQAPRRQSARKRSQLVPSKSEDVPSPSKGLHGSLKDSHKQVPNFSSLANPGISMALSSTPSKESSLGFQKAPEVSLLSDSKSSTKRPRSSTNYRKPACDSCRKRRRACKHRDQILPFTLNVRGRESVGDPTQGTSTMPNTEPKAFDVDATPFSGRDEDSFMTIPGGEGGSKEKLEIHHEPNSENAPSEQRTDDLRRAQCDTMQNMSFKRYDSTSSIIIPNRGRTKACNDCRKSKRRCVHDEHGNEDPVKVREAAIPRPSAAFKRRKFDTEGQGSRTNMKAKSFIDSALTQISTSPSQNALQSNHDTEGSMTDPKAKNDNNSPRSQQLGQVRESTSSSLVRPVIHPPERKPLENVENAHSSVSTSSQAMPDEICLTQDGAPRRGDAIEGNGKYLLRSSSNPDLTKSSCTRNAYYEQSENFNQPAASSLVSPPASSHEDAGKSPPPPSHSELTRSSSSSRHSSRHLKQVQRYTPESGPVRRRASSSSSVGKDPSAVDKQITSTATDNSSTTKEAETIEDVPRAVPKVDLGPEEAVDEESLKLIKELQAQAYGLRRRGRD